ncbi:MAG TPA: hypothetical protein DCQ83_08290 [Fibrobacteres bacterium]|jgi:hypothetical protein|nr:hypothetical protein [Fibrobacterota bacterium]
MKSGMKWILSGLPLLMFSAASTDVVRNPVNAGVALEAFQLYNANSYLNLAHPAEPLLMVRPTGWIFESATINDRISLVMGIGATTFSLPHDSGSYPRSTNYQTELFPAVALVQASGSYTWGDLKEPALKLTFGQMPYKYNPDAKNLGEYLFRSTPYPNTVLNSPFDLVNSAQANILALMLSKNMFGGSWKNDLLITSATQSSPLYDFSLAYVTSYRISPILELGAGVNLFRLIPVQPSITTWKADTNRYPDSSGYYSLKGQMIMARFSLDFKPVLGTDLKLYGEGTLLGVQNFPRYYDKMMDRLPVMVGLNIPTWGVLDMLNVEMEYWKNPYLNSTLGIINNGSGTPNLDYTNSYKQLDLKPTDAVKDDDLRWSVSATRSLAKTISLTAKAANDHLQMMEFNVGGFPSKSYGDVMSRKGSWYYVLRVQVAI